MAKTKIISKMTDRFCKDCKFFEPPKMSPAPCTHEDCQIKDLVFGVTGDQIPCHLARMPGAPCGPEGRLFVRKENERA